jgi:hypothetical protein
VWGQRVKAGEPGAGCRRASIELGLAQLGRVWVWASNPRVRGHVEGVGSQLRTHSGSARHPCAQTKQRGHGVRIVQLAQTAQTAYAERESPLTRLR